MGFLSSVGKLFSSVPIVGDIASAFLGDSIADNNADHANHIARQNSDIAWARYKNRYKETTEDMKRAGLNPILASTGGFNVSGQPSTAQSFQSSPQQISFGSTAQSMSQADKNKAETELTQQKTELTKNEAIHELKKIQKTIAENRVLKQQEAEVIERTSLLMEQNAKTNSEWKLTNEKRKEVVLLNQRLRATLKKIGKQ
jgi:organic radical activating enzyme